MDWDEVRFKTILMVSEYIRLYKLLVYVTCHYNQV